MKNILIGLAIVLAIGGYYWWSIRSSSDVSSNIPPTTSLPSDTTNPTATGSNPPPTTTPATTGYKDGTYTGSVSNSSIYGPVQVAVTIASGKIVAVTVPVFPNAPGHTIEVTNEAIPLLKQEAIVSQSANVNIVSGATQTSEAFQISLTSALAQAS